MPIRSPVSDRSALASDREAMMTSVIAGLTGDQIIQLVGRRWVGRTPGDRGALKKRELVIRSDQAVRAGTFSTIRGAVLYVVAGRRPPAP